MAIRITGMYSGLDTESIINELASAQSYKKNKLVKAQTKLSWKQDAWKSLNTKIYSFYQKLDDLRLQSSYMKKKTTVSNSNAIKVSGGKADGAHSVLVKQLSKRATVTSGKLSKGNVNYTENATLGQLGFTADSGSIRISDKNGEYVNIDVTKDMKISDFVKAIEDSTSLTASFDRDNQRIFINSWASGENANFFLSGDDAGGMEALKTLKLLSTNDINALTQPGGEYDVWSKYIDADLAADPPESYTAADYSADYKKLLEQEVLARVKAMKAQNDALEKENKDYDEANQKNLDKLKEILANADHKYDDYADYIDGYNSAWTLDNADDVKAAGEALYDKIYGAKTTEQAKDEEGNLLYEEDGTTPVMVRAGGMAGDLKTLQDDLTTKQDALKTAREALAADSENETLKQAVADAEQAVADASKAVSEQQTKMDKAKEVYSFYNAFNYNADKKQDNLDTIAYNNDRFTYEKKDDGTEIYKVKNAASGGPDLDIADAVANGTGLLSNEIAAQFDKKVAAAKKAMKDKDQLLADAADQAVKIDGQDSKITVDGVDYNSANDTVTVNGLEITALETTDKEVTVSTTNDTDGVYDMIKDFVKSYSELMNEMDSLYNAESAKDYEPLLAEEKEALTDSEVEEWEKKIKDSLLRRDSTLSDVSSAMRMSMMMTMDLDGETISLADFGIATLGYFAAADNERNAYHIDGDPDDAKTKNNDDKLRRAITNNPEAVMDFFTKLTNGLHDTLADKMSATKMSSALTVYNDKKMKEDYDDYTDKIKKQEEKLNAYIDKWYAKFSAMETALSKLESKNNSLASLFGG